VIPGEYRVFGPPGTGKTSFLRQQVEKWAGDVGADRLLVSTFTRAAAAEIASRVEGIVPDRQVGTLHALAFRCLDHPEVAEPHAREFSDAFPAYRLSGDGTDRRRGLDDGYVEVGARTEGDALLARMEECRARMLPRELWPASVEGFARAWGSWKQDAGYLDFTDLIELARDNVAVAPGEPTVGFFDEVQDFTPLELSLVRRWGARMSTVLLAGDDDQCIYAFKGATPDAFLDPPVPDDRKRVLSRSYRLPRAVHRVAQSWVERLGRREPKRYEPRDEDGAVRTSVAGYRAPELVVDDALGQVEAGCTVMILAACSYMLDPVRHALRREAAPFHNPYRRARGDWNPLARGTSRRRMPTDRLLAYLRPDPDAWGRESREWTGDDLKAWSQPFRQQGVLVRGARQEIDALPGRPDVDPEWLEERLAPERRGYMYRWLGMDLDWYESCLLASRRRPFEYPLRVARRRGGRALLDPPRIVLGTVHSVKGGEADVVYLFPDLSAPGVREWADPATRDRVVRQFYVGMTRARQELVVCAPSTPMAVPREQLLGEAS